MPSSHIDLIQEIANQNNSVRYFMSAGGVQRMPLAKDGKPSCRISEQALYEGYYAFCMAIAHVRPVVLKKFRLMARELQNEFEFQIVPNGASAHYENLTLAGGKDSS
jgi:putative DNA primase/helicase